MKSQLSQLHATVGLSIPMYSLLVAFSLIATSRSMADDWPQWQGKDRSGVSQESGLATKWAEDGPPLLWINRDAGLGYAGFSVVGDRLYTMGTDDQRAQLVCLHSQTGKLIWATPLDEFFENRWGDGPRSTPTIDGDRVYALTSNGQLACANASDGKLLWTQEMKQLGGKVPTWGYSESVLIDGDQVVCTPGGKQGTVAAFNKLNGELIWQSEDITDYAHYSSLTKAKLNGREFYVQLTKDTVFGISPDDGSLIWEAAWAGKTAVIPTPIFRDGTVYVTSGYGTGSARFDLADFSQPKVIYKNKVMKNHHGGVVLIDGHLYGHSDGAGWVCQEFQSGDRVWSERNELGKGCVTAVGDMLYCVDERKGEVALIKAATSGWEESGRFTLSPQSEQRKGPGGIWVHPVIANGKMYLRDQELIYCFDVTAAGE